MCSFKVAQISFWRAGVQQESSRFARHFEERRRPWGRTKMARLSHVVYGDITAKILAQINQINSNPMIQAGPTPSPGLTPYSVCSLVGSFLFSLCIRGGYPVCFLKRFLY